MSVLVLNARALVVKSRLLDARPKQDAAPSRYSFHQPGNPKIIENLMGVSLSGGAIRKLEMFGVLVDDSHREPTF